MSIDERPGWFKGMLIKYHDYHGLVKAHSESAAIQKAKKKGGKR